MTPILHHVPGSRSLRILWLLEEMGITPEVRPYQIADGSLRAAEYLERSPAGRVPALEIDGRVIYESGAITEYLCETRPDHGLGRAPGDVDRVPFLEAMHYAETMAHIIAGLNLQWVFLRDPAQRSDVVAKIDARRLAGTMAPLEATFARQDHVLASGFSAADTMLGFNFDAAGHFVRLEAFPHIRSWMARMEERPALRRARALDGPQKFYDRDFYAP
ncbi:glutathione S-transferase family protein [Pseudooceanicola aestuarii]|uniref:glutathione S-transferase family protein n=1 Tax=Pseudooceanicola aestuarii TaxID=2697319 RepID=UPI0013D6C54A|nr:glutathione S-transferase [Pseudooceanicola aestuarii]